MIKSEMWNRKESEYRYVLRYVNTCITTSEQHHLQRQKRYNIYTHDQHIPSCTALYTMRNMVVSTHAGWVASVVVTVYESR